MTGRRVAKVGRGNDPVEFSGLRKGQNQDLSRSHRLDPCGLL
jgi:hypothetical protein